MENPERLMQRYTDATQALATLKEMIMCIEKEGGSLDPIILQGLYDSIIQRFEITYDATWKFLKAFFQSRGIIAQSPREAFQQCLNSKLVKQKEADALFDMVLDRNLTTHLYNQKMAGRVRGRIVAIYFPIISQLLERISI